jgi:hypothetical protein
MSIFDVDDRVDRFDEITIWAQIHDYLMKNMDQIYQGGERQHRLMNKTIAYNSSERKYMDDLSISNLPLELFPFISYTLPRSLDEFLSDMNYTYDNDLIIMLKEDADINSLYLEKIHNKCGAWVLRNSDIRGRCQGLYGYISSNIVSN